MCTCGCEGEESEIDPEGNWVKFSDIKDILNTSDNKQSKPLPERNCCAIHTFLPLNEDGTCESCGL